MSELVCHLVIKFNGYLFVKLVRSQLVKAPTCAFHGLSNVLHMQSMTPGVCQRLMLLLVYFRPIYKKLLWSFSLLAKFRYFLLTGEASTWGCKDWKVMLLNSSILTIVDFGLVSVMD